MKTKLQTKMDHVCIVYIYICLLIDTSTKKKNVFKKPRKCIVLKKQF